jgi:hypothetical protein
VLWSRIKEKLSAKKGANSSPGDHLQNGWASIKTSRTQAGLEDKHGAAVMRVRALLGGVVCAVWCHEAQSA